MTTAALDRAAHGARPVTPTPELPRDNLQSNNYGCDVVAEQAAA